MSTISNLPVVTTVTGGLVLPVMDNGKTKQISLDAIGGYINNELESTILPPATTSTLGGIIVGDGLAITTSGSLSIVDRINIVATTSTLGGVIAGSGVNITPSGVISVNTSQPIASTTTVGIVKIGANINITTSGTISVAAPFVLATATDTVLGGVKVGS